MNLFAMVGAETGVAMTAITTGISTVFQFVGTAIEQITTNEVLCFILASSLVGIVLRTVSQIKNTAR